MGTETLQQAHARKANDESPSRMRRRLGRVVAHIGVQVDICRFECILSDPPALLPLFHSCSTSPSARSRASPRNWQTRALSGLA
jgi:hypothetical protein